MIKNNFFRITPHENLLVAEFFGSWNMSVTKEYLSEAFKAVGLHYSNKQYAVLDDFRKWELNTPEAMEFWTETFSNTNISLPTHVAHVVGNSGLKSWVIETMTKETISVEKAFFHDIHEGLKWLESYGYKTPESVASLNPDSASLN